MADICPKCGVPMVQRATYPHQEGGVTCWRRRAEKAEAERDEIKEEVSLLRAALHDYEQMIAEAETEVARLKEELAWAAEALQSTAGSEDPHDYDWAKDAADRATRAALGG